MPCYIPILRVHGYWYPVFDLSPVFDCAGTTPSVSFSEEIEVEVEQEVEFGPVPRFRAKSSFDQKKVVDLPLCNSKLFLKLIVALWKLCIIHIHILCIYNYIYIYIYLFIYLFIYLHTVLLNDKCMYTYFSFTSPTWDHASVRKWLVSTKHHIMSRRRVSNARCLGETLAILHHQYQDFRSVLREFYLLICLSLIAIDFWTAAISI